VQALWKIRSLVEGLAVPIEQEEDYGG